MYTVALIGAGNRGQLLARSFDEVSEFEIVAVADSVDERGRQVAARFGAAAVADVDGALETDPDVVIIATPDFAHLEVVSAVAGSGAALYIEKPLATDLGEAVAIRDALDSRGTRVAVGFDNRWNPTFQAAKNAIDSGQLGTIIGQTAVLNDTVWVPTQMLSWGARSSPAWFLMSHTLDLAQWLSGHRAVEVSAAGTRGVCEALGVDTWDAIYAHVRMTDGSVLALNSAWALPENMPQAFDFNYDVMGDRGFLRMNLSENGPRLWSDGTARSLNTAYGERGERVSGTAVEAARDFRRLLDGEAVEMPTLADGVSVTAAITAVHRSLESGRWESVTNQ